MFVFVFVFGDENLVLIILLGILFLEKIEILFFISYELFVIFKLGLVEEK